MFRGMYSAATGMNVASRVNELTADNIAHAITPGFRQRGAVFETFERTLDQLTGAAPSSQIGAQVAQGYSNFTPGPLEYTQQPYDFALTGDGYFALQGPTGTVYSRDGVFQRGANGALLNTGGLPVLGQRGPVVIPPTARDVVVTREGDILADGLPVDRLQLARFNTPSRLVPVGISLFEAPADAGQAPANSTVIQGARERSNVEVASAMVNLVRDVRYFDAAQRALRAISDATQLVTRP